MVVRREVVLGWGIVAEPEVELPVGAAWVVLATDDSLTEEGIVVVDVAATLESPSPSLSHSSHVCLQKTVPNVLQRPNCLMPEQPVPLSSQPPLAAGLVVGCSPLSPLAGVVLAGPSIGSAVQCPHVDLQNSLPTVEHNPKLSTEPHPVPTSWQSSPSSPPGMGLHGPRVVLASPGSSPPSSLPSAQSSQVFLQNEEPTALQSWRALTPEQPDPESAQRSIGFGTDVVVAVVEMASPPSLDSTLCSSSPQPCSMHATTAPKATQTANRRMHAMALRESRCEAA